MLGPIDRLCYTFAIEDCERGRGTAEGHLDTFFSNTEQAGFFKIVDGLK